MLLVLVHHRRRVIHFNVTEHPTAQWTAQQIVEAFPWDTAPKYLLRDRNAIYGKVFQRRVESMGIGQVLSAPRSPWQNPYVERLIGTVRRDCLDHVIVLNERHLRNLLTCYLTCHDRAGRSPRNMKAASRIWEHTGGRRWARGRTKFVVIVPPLLNRIRAKPARTPDCSASIACRAYGKLSCVVFRHKGSLAALTHRLPCHGSLIPGERRWNRFIAGLPDLTFIA